MNLYRAEISFPELYQFDLRIGVPGSVPRKEEISPEEANYLNIVIPTILTLDTGPVPDFTVIFDNNI